MFAGVQAASAFAPYSPEQEINTQAVDTAMDVHC